MNDDLTQPQGDHDKVEKVYKSIYGDGNGDIGMKKKVDAMYPIVQELAEFLQGTKFSTRLLRNTVTFTASLCIAIYVIVQVLRGRNPF